MTESVSRAINYLKMLKDDPRAVHLAMLRGTIATPDTRSLLHVTGDLVHWDNMKRMEKALQHYAEGPDGEVAMEALKYVTLTFD